MKRNRLKEAIALAVCVCGLGAPAANAQLVIGSSSDVQSSVSEMSSLEAYNGSFIVNRFGVRDGRLVAYGRLIPTEGSTSVGIGASSEVDADLSSSVMPQASSSSSVSLGSSSTSGGIGLRTRTDWGVNSSFDWSALGNWTGIGSGYGESGVESRSTLPSDDDGPTSFNLARPYDDQSYMEDISRSGSSSSSGVDLQMGPTSGNDRVGAGIDAQFGPTSGNDRVGAGVDLQMGPTSGNDHVGGGVDVQMGPTSGNDRVGAGVDVHMGPTSGNDRTTIDADLGVTSDNDRTGVDVQFGPTSGNDRVAGGDVDLQMGPTSGNDREGVDVSMGATSGNDRTGVDLKMGPTSGNDRTSLGVDLRADGRPLIQLGGSGSLYSNEESDRAMIVSSASEDVAVPVSIVSASCDAVSLSFGGTQPVTVTSTSTGNETLCSVSTASASGDNTMLLKYLNQLISQTR
jgi:hypothetical protein